MKRFFCIVVTLCLCISFAWGEGLDYSEMTDEQLIDAFNSIRIELLRRSLSIAFDEKKAEELTVNSLSWTRTVNIEENRMFSESGWELPEGAELTDSKEEIHHYDEVIDHYESVEVQRSREVLDHYETYYTYQDNGKGSFEEISHERPVYKTEYYTETEQRPVYSTVPQYQTKYYFNIWRWMLSRDATASGSDHNVSWPSYTLGENEREGQRYEIYCFTAKSSEGSGKTFTYCLAEKDWMNINIGDSILVSAELDGADTWIVDESGNKIAELVLEK